MGLDNLINDVVGILKANDLDNGNMDKSFNLDGYDVTVRVSFWKPRNQGILRNQEIIPQPKMDANLSEVPR